MPLPYLHPYIPPSQGKRPRSGVWLSPISSRQLQQWGKCFIIWHAPDAEANLLERAINQLSERLVTSYYPKALMPNLKEREDQIRSRLSFQFEETLQTLNTAIQEQSLLPGFPWSRTVNIVVGVAHESIILLANHRAFGAWFVRERSDASSTNRWEELTEEKSGPSFFSDVVSGALAPGQTIVVASPLLFESISRKELSVLIDQAEDTEEISTELNERATHSRNDIAAALFIFALEEEVEEEAQLENATAHSSGELSVLTYSKALAVLLRRLLAWTWHWATIALSALRVRLPFFWPWLKGSSATIVAWCARAIQHLWSTIKTTWYLLRLGIAVAVKDRGTQEELTAILHTQHVVVDLTQSLKTTRSRYQELSLYKKALLWGVLAILIIIPLGANIRKLQQSRARIQQEQAGRLDDIRRMRDDIDGRLIFGDDRGVSELLRNAQVKIELLPRTNAEEQKIYAALKKDLENSEHKLHHEIALPSPKVIVALPEELQHLTRAGKHIATSGKTNLFLFDTEALTTQSAFQKIPLAKELSSVEQLIGGSNTSNIFAFSNTKAQQWTIGKTVTSRILTLPTPLVSPALYASRLYGIDPTKRQIIKLAPTAQGWTNPTPWLINNQLPKETSLLASDGSMYTASNESVNKYFNSAPAAFSFIITPALKKPVSLKTVSKPTWLILVDRGANRVVIIDKGTPKITGGRVIAQLTQERWIDLADADVNVQAKLLTVIHGKFIEQYALPTMK